MTDLYDEARPVRDAALKEIDRLTGGADFDPEARSANILGVSLTAVMMAFTAHRHRQLRGLIQDEHLHQVIGSGIATMIANAAMAYRPYGPGQKPLHPQQVAMMLLEKIGNATMHQVMLNAEGLQDYVIPLHRNEHGSLEVTPFDFSGMLRKGPK